MMDLSTIPSQYFDYLLKEKRAKANLAYYNENGEWMTVEDIETIALTDEEIENYAKIYFSKRWGNEESCVLNSLSYYLQVGESYEDVYDALTMYLFEMIKVDITDEEVSSVWIENFDESVITVYGNSSPDPITIEFNNNICLKNYLDKLTIVDGEIPMEVNTIRIEEDYIGFDGYAMNRGDNFVLTKELPM